jgi:molybdopterin synthase catalytic subunit
MEYGKVGFFMIEKNTGVVQKGEVCLMDLINLAKRNPESKRAGAIVTFTGIVRGYTHDGKRVEKLEVDAYKEIAEKSLEKIAFELSSRPGVVGVMIYHSVGMFKVGEELVHVVVIADSRRNAFSTAQEAVERYKQEAALWKKEFLSDGSAHWVVEKHQAM